MNLYIEEQYARNHDHSGWIDGYSQDYYDSNNNKADYYNQNRQKDAGRYYASPNEQYFEDHGQFNPKQSETTAFKASQLTAETTTSLIDEAMESTSAFAFSTLSNIHEPFSTATAAIKKQEERILESTNSGEGKAAQHTENLPKGSVKKASVNGDNTRDSSPSFHLPPGTNLGIVGKLGAYQVAHKKPVSAASTSSIVSHQFNMLGFYFFIFFVTFFLMKKIY